MIQEDIGEETVLMEEMGGAPGAEPEPPDEWEEELMADEGLKDLRAEEGTEELEDMEIPEAAEQEELFEEQAPEATMIPIPLVEGMVETEEEAVAGAAFPISEEKVEAIVTKAAGALA